MFDCSGLCWAVLVVISCQVVSSCFRDSKLFCWLYLLPEIRVMLILVVFNCVHVSFL